MMPAWQPANESTLPQPASKWTATTKITALHKCRYTILPRYFACTFMGMLSLMVLRWRTAWYEALHKACWQNTAQYRISYNPALLRRCCCIMLLRMLLSCKTAPVQRCCCTMLPPLSILPTIVKQTANQPKAPLRCLMSHNNPAVHCLSCLSHHGHTRIHTTELAHKSPLARFLVHRTTRFGLPNGAQHAQSRRCA